MVNLGGKTVRQEGAAGADAYATGLGKIDTNIGGDLSSLTVWR
jgi:hypothetical protein